jgi:hypothetical protein
LFVLLKLICDLHVKVMLSNWCSVFKDKDSTPSHDVLIGIVPFASC